MTEGREQLFTRWGGLGVTVLSLLGVGGLLGAYQFWEQRKTAQVAQHLQVDRLNQEACDLLGGQEAVSQHREWWDTPDVDLARAERKLDEALHLDANNPNTYHVKGQLLYQQRRYQLAEAAVRYALKIKDDHRFHYTLGAVLDAQKRPDEAITEIRKALCCRDDATIRSVLGVAYIDKGEFEAAEREARLAIARDPVSVVGYDVLGDALSLQGRSDEAIEAMRRVIEIDPKSYRGYSNLAGVLGRVGHDEEAIALCRRAIKLKPNYPYAYVNLFMSLAALGRSAEALEAARGAVRRFA